MSRLLVALLLAMAASAACSGSAAPAGQDGQPVGTVTVLAAASLTEAFTALGEQFEAEHPGTQVAFSFGSSTGLAQAVTAGAPADVYASASADAMRVVTDAGDAAGRPQVIARNELQIAVPAGNPAQVTRLEDLADPDRTIALCARQVPCGQAAAQVLAAAGVAPAPDTLEQDVRAALSKVVLGEVDAALVYRTDVRAAGAAVEGIDVPGAASAANEYAVVALDAAPNPVAAQAFLDLVTSAAGRQALAAAGFEAA